MLIKNELGGFNMGLWEFLNKLERLPGSTMGVATAYGITSPVADQVRRATAQVDKKICQYCGKEVALTEKVCPHCGKELGYIPEYKAYKVIVGTGVSAAAKAAAATAYGITSPVANAAGKVWGIATPIANAVATKYGITSPNTDTEIRATARKVEKATIEADVIATDKEK